MQSGCFTRVYTCHAEHLYRRLACTDAAPLHAEPRRHAPSERPLDIAQIGHRAVFTGAVMGTRNRFMVSGRSMVTLRCPRTAGMLVESSRVRFLLPLLQNRPREPNVGLVDTLWSRRGKPPAKDPRAACQPPRLRSRYCESISSSGPLGICLFARYGEHFKKIRLESLHHVLPATRRWPASRSWPTSAPTRSPRSKTRKKPGRRSNCDQNSVALPAWLLSSLRPWRPSRRRGWPAPRSWPSPCGWRDMVKAVEARAGSFENECLIASREKRIYNTKEPRSPLSGAERSQPLLVIVIALFLPDTDHSAADHLSGSRYNSTQRRETLRECPSARVRRTRIC